MQKVAVVLIKTALAQNFESAYHQREFLRCLTEAGIEKSLTGERSLTYYRIYLTR